MQLDWLRRQIRLFLLIVFGFAFFVQPTPGLAMSTGACWGTVALETFIPGLGYGVSSQYGKGVLFGGGRWITSRKYYQAIERDDYQENSNEIYVTTEATKSPSGKTETDIYLNNSTYQAQFYGTIESDLWLVSLGDLYRSRCEPDNETYDLALAPLRFDHFYTNWRFWLPIGALAVSAATYGDTSVTRYHLGTGLTESRIKRDTWQQFYMVGFGEEMFFRGVVQQSFYNNLNQELGFGPRASQHLSVWGSAAVFGLAHNGQGFSANSAYALAMGAYLGYAYMPEPGTQDLMTVIAIHAWWDIGVMYTILNNSSFTRTDSKVEVPLLAFGTRF